MQPARGFRIANGFTDGHGEGDDVVLHFGFELVDACDVDLGAGTQHRGRVLGHLTGFRQRVGGGQFNVEPFLEAIGVAPDMSHFFAGIARYHVGLSKGIYCNDTAFVSGIKPTRVFAGEEIGRGILACGA